MKSYTRLNNIIGWIVFAVAFAVYIVTSEPTASFWDCGEYISTAYKLMVGHPPGAPFFQLLGRIFTLFAGDTSQVARMINTMSALVSGFTILFLFWSITMLAKKIVAASGEMTKEKMVAVFGSGAVGALAYTFSDSFWFSAVEGEVYAMSSFFTAIVFWAILKWETVADDKYSMKWIILIFYLMGLSIGVHLLNLLTIPAITFVYYFKKYKSSRKGIIITSIISILILGFVQSGIIPWVVSLAGKFELFFVNNIGLPFNSGTIIYFLVLTAGIVAGLIYTHKYSKVIANTVILCITFIIIGYSTFFLLPIRSIANTPLDENNPENAISLLAYLNREQYGDWPVFYGPYYNAPLDRNNSSKDGTPVWDKDTIKGKHVKTDERKNVIPNYDSRFCTIFPRMWSSQGDHIPGYKSWGRIEGRPVYDPDGTPVKNERTGEVIMKPTFGENLKYFFSYQLGHMYFRYFLWNFVGRQNGNQGFGDAVDGNWLSGVNFIDSWLLGSQDNLPDRLAKDRARNKLYFLPLILGLIGLIYHMKVNYKDFVVIALFFFFTGIAINIYLNPVCPQPRERDYAYAGSFYVFAIWIGIGVLSLYESFKKKINGNVSASLAVLICLLLVPGIMAREEWDDHDRSDRYTCLDFACNYLNSCAPNAILFTNGDNDTFPLWYAQEVEGIRTDVRVCNLSLFNTDWYIDQMKRKAYLSDPMPLSMTKDKYRQGGICDWVLIKEVPSVKGYVPLKDLINFVASDDPQTKLSANDQLYAYFPTKNFSIPVDSVKVVNNGTVPKDKAGRIVKNIEWSLNKYGIYKNHFEVLDLLANNNWDRPVYFAITTGADSYLGLQDYFQLEGLAYRFIPIKAKNKDGQTGSINTTVMYDNLMNKFKWGNIQDPEVYLNEDNMRMTMNFRNNFARLANALMDEGKKDSAIKVCDRCMEVLPEKTVPFNYSVLPIAETYYSAGVTDKAVKIMDKLLTIYDGELKYLTSLGSKMRGVEFEIKQDIYIVQRIAYTSRMQKQKQLEQKSMEILKKYYQFLPQDNNREVPPDDSEE